MSEAIDAFAIAKALHLNFQPGQAQLRMNPQEYVDVTDSLYLMVRLAQNVSVPLVTPADTGHFPSNAVAKVIVAPFLDGDTTDMATVLRPHFDHMLAGSKVSLALPGAPKLASYIKSEQVTSESELADVETPLVVHAMKGYSSLSEPCRLCYLFEPAILHDIWEGNKPRPKIKFREFT